MTDTNAFIVSRPIHAPMVRAPRPAQYALSGSALEWQGYRASCIRVQQTAVRHQDAAQCSTKGPDAAGP